MYSLYQGDCLEIMRGMDSKSVDLIVTDPPYGIDYKSSWSDKFDRIKNDSDLDFVPELFYQLDRISKDNTHMYCFVPVQNIDIFCTEIKKYWEIRNLITIPRTMKGGVGSLKSSFSCQNEFCIYATKGNRIFEKTEILRPSETYLKDKRRKPKEWLYRLPDYWYWIKASEHNLKRLHPTQKTVDVFETMIKLSSKENEMVLDCFMGVGSSGVACLKTNRNFIGIELDEKYFNIAEKRLKGE